MIDVSFDFTTDSPWYWEGFWERKAGLGKGKTDPDAASHTLRDYHSILWSKDLPVGERMNLKKGSGSYYLSWKEFRFGSDSLIVSFRYHKYKSMIEQVMKKIPDYHPFYEDLLHKSYTIGGMIIFPKHRGSINQRKGWNPYVSDRWDLTLECIRRYYDGQNSPLYDTLLADKKFFDLFVDFKGYVDFFFLQDMVSDDYSTVDIWCGDTQFIKSGLPETLEDYFAFIDREMEFLAKRNERISNYCKEKSL